MKTKIDGRWCEITEFYYQPINKKYMNKYLGLLKSRTFWSAVVLFLVAGVDGIKDLIPHAVQLPLDVVLTALVGYFRANPKV